MNVIIPFLRQATLTPQAPALVLGEFTVTYGALAAYARAATHWLREAGFKRGDRIAVVGAGPFEQLVSSLATAWLGAAVADLPSRAASNALSTVSKRLGLAGVIICERPDQAAPDPASTASLKVVRFADIYKPTPDNAEGVPIAKEVVDALWRIGFSTGTTGEPKAIAWSHLGLGVVAVQVKSLYPFRPGWRVFMALSAQVQFAVNYIMAALHAGATVIFATSPEPQALLEEVRKQQPHQFIISSGLATRIAQHLAQKVPGTARVTPDSLQIVCSGGSVLSAGVQEVIRTRIAPEFYNHYGASEAGLMARTSPEMQMKAPLLSGRLAQWMEGEAMDDDDRPLPPGTVGRLRFRGPGMSSGYLGDEEANKQHFRNGWFYPGDLGAVTQQGFLVLAGREDERFNFGGMKYHPLSIEKIINTHPQVVESAVTAGFARGEQIIVALVVLNDGADIKTIEGELAALSEKHLGGGGPHSFFAVKSLPSSEGGKLKREELPKLLASLTSPANPS
jgi:acyl-coenzyme A synthetase/AMP-(fatty) acid ligase